MSIEINEVQTSKELKKFINVPFELYKDSKYWLPPLKSDERKALKKETNPSSEFCDFKLWYAMKDGKIAGRIGGIINHLYNQKIDQKIGRFMRFESINDINVAKALLETAEKWSKSLGMTKIHGPLGFSNLDTQGMLIEGFDYLPSVGSVYHKPYYKEFFENLGYEKEIDWIEFRLTIGENAINKASRGAELIKKRYGIEVVHFSKTKELLNYSDYLFNILNDAFADLPFVVPFSPKMVEYYKDKYIRMLNPKYVKMVKQQDEIIGFVVGMPSLSEAMQKAAGRLFPFGIFHILKARKGGGDTIDQILTGVMKEHQATGAAVILMAELQNVMLQHGNKYIETTGIIESNHSAISNWKNYEHIQHKRRRCFIKDLDN